MPPRKPIKRSDEVTQDAPPDVIEPPGPPAKRPDVIEPPHEKKRSSLPPKEIK